MLKTVIPSSIKRSLRKAHRGYILRRSLARARVLMERRRPFSERLFEDLIYGWGNEGWSANSGLLHAILEERVDAESSILECGTGLSTILLSMIADQTGSRYRALEHHEQWYEVICRQLANLGLRTDRVVLAPLRSHGDFDWYDCTSCFQPEEAFSLILCDGPPSQTRGGRYGLLPLMLNRMRPGTRIIVDDAHREDETTIMRNWSAAFGKRIELTAQKSTFAVLTIR